MLDGAQRVGRGADDQVAGQQQVGLLGVDAHLVELVGRQRQPHERQHRPALLRKAHEVEHRGLLALEVRGHRDQCADRDHAAAADASDQQVERAAPDPRRRRRQVGQLARERAGVDAVDAFLRHRALDGHEARAEAVQAGIVLVARGLLDLALAAPVGLDRDHAQAVAGHAAVAAALADALVDEHAPGRLGQQALLAPAAQLGRAGLVVDQQGHAGHFAQFALHRVELAAVVKARAARKLGGAAAVLGDVVADHGDAPGALGLDLARDLGHAELAVDRLATGHRDRVVVEQLVGDVRARRDGLPDGQQPGVEVGAVAEVLEDMRLAREARMRDPVDALAAHLDQPAGAALHPAGHEVAADAGQRARTLGHLRAGVVRAARAEVRLAPDGVGGVGQQRGHREVDDQRPAVERRVQPREPLGDHGHDARGPQLAQGRDQRPTLGVGLAGNPWALGVGHCVEQLLDLALDDRRLFLDDQDVLDIGDEVEHARGLDRVDQADLVDAHAGGGQRVGVERQAAQDLHEVVVRLADRHDAQRRARAGHDVLVDRVELRERAHRIELEREPGLDLERGQVERAHVQVGARGRVDRQREVQPHAVEVDRHARLDDLADCLEADPGPRVARQRPAVEAELEVLGDVARVQHRHAPGLQGEVALVRHRRADAAVVVAGDDQHAAQRRRAVGVAVLERVAGAVDPRALAIPQRVDAVDRALGVERDALRAQAGGRGQVLVDRRQELHLRRVEQLLGLPQLLVDHAQRRAAVARDEARGPQPGGIVEPALHQQQPHQGLRAGQEHDARVGGEVVVQAVVAQRRGRSG